MAARRRRLERFERGQRGNDLDRLWSKVDIRGSDECWLWIAAIDRDGYGQMKVGGVQEKAHRLAWQFSNGTDIPDNMIILHTCDNPSCCNPAHLILGTARDNTQDMIKKGRRWSVHGERNGMSKLTDTDVLLIFDLAESGEHGSVIARKFNVGDSTISAILRGDRWKHIRRDK